MAVRFKATGKDRFILILVTDHDPEGEEIAISTARSLRDDFGIYNICPVRSAITPDQIQKLGLVPVLEAKEKSSQYAKFVEKYGKDVFELEALEPSQLEGILTETIESVLDIDAYNSERDQEESDMFDLQQTKKKFMDFMKTEEAI